jgi:hypothetical protein
VKGWGRREFLLAGTAGASAILIPDVFGAPPGTELAIAGLLGKLRKEEGKTPIPGGGWYVAEAEGDGISYRFPAGALSEVKHLTADFLLDGSHLAVFSIALKEGDGGREFQFGFGGLTQCSFRMRMPLALVDQGRWRMEREGAFLKPMCRGDRVDLAKVDRMTFTVHHKSAAPLRWSMTPIHTSSEAQKVSKPLLPKGKLLDEFGQSAQHDWPAKTRSLDELKQRIQAQSDRAASQSWPEGFSRWGGWKAKKLTDAKGFFRTHFDGRRWWLVDPDGYAFWSAGLDCVRVDTEARYDGLETALKWLPDPKGPYGQIYRTSERERLEGKFVNYLAANMIRTFGPSGWRDKWAGAALAEMKRLRFNTVGNWSEWEFARKAGFPYVRPMDFEGNRCGTVYRDFPDVFHPGFEDDAVEYASQLTETRDDPAFIGYFLMNEPTWGFSRELPAAGMLYLTESCHTRTELVRFLKTRHAGDAGLQAAWKMPVTLDKVASGKWGGVLTKEATDDLREFSVLMVERYFQVISSACRKADPNHLNLGMRWAGIPPEWAVRGMKHFDVYSLNCYKQKLPLADATKIHDMLKMPVMVGEWHFGALDAGLPASGIGHVKNQADRGRAYRVYLEDAAADPYCVGAHWFTLYDQSALGRFDGENYNIGFLDVCNRPYEQIGSAAIASHERMYQVADGQGAPYADAPEYLPLLFL